VIYSYIAWPMKSKKMKNIYKGKKLSAWPMKSKKMKNIYKRKKLSQKL
jgi:hypothetical protein